MVLVGDEAERPYERPPLSKDYLRGEAGREKVYVHDEGFYAEHDIELRLERRAVRPGPVQQRGRARQRRAASATTGCCSRPARSPGGCRCPAPTGRCSVPAQRRGLRCAARAARPRRRGRRGRGRMDRREVAASARQRGLEVTVLDPLQCPTGARARRRGRRDIPRHPRETMARSCSWAAALRRSKAGRLSSGCERSDGRELECDFVVVGVGVEPRTELGSMSGADPRQRDRRRRLAPHERSGGVRGRRRGECASPVLWRADARACPGR